MASAVPAVLEALGDGGVRDADVTLLCANALHRKFTAAELGGILGEGVVGAFADRLACHDAEDPEGNVHLGTTAGGITWRSTGWSSNPT